MPRNGEKRREPDWFWMLIDWIQRCIYHRCEGKFGPGFTAPYFDGSAPLEEGNQSPVEDIFPLYNFVTLSLLHSLAYPPTHTHTHMEWCNTKELKIWVVYCYCATLFVLWNKHCPNRKKPTLYFVHKYCLAYSVALNFYTKKQSKIQSWIELPSYYDLTIYWEHTKICTFVWSPSKF